MRIGDGIDFTQGIEAASNLEFSQRKVADKAGAYDLEPQSNARASLGLDTASIGGVNLDIAMKGAESTGATKREAHVQTVKDQILSGNSYNVSASAILDVAPQLIEIVG